MSLANDFECVATHNFIYFSIWLPTLGTVSAPAAAAASAPAPDAAPAACLRP